MKKLMATVAGFALVSSVALANYQMRQNDEGIEFRNFNEARTEAFELDRHSLIKMDRYARHYDDFLGDVLADEWTPNSGTVAADPAITSNSINGELGIISSFTNAGYAADGAQINSALNYQADQGGLVMEAYVKPSSTTSQTIFIGFTDSASLEQPLNFSTGVATQASATDAVGFLFDSVNTTQQWYGVGVDTGVTATAVATGISMTAAYKTFKVAVDTSGNATMYIDGDLVATIGDALSATVQLTPIVSVQSNDAVTTTVSVDYLQAQQKR